MDKLFLKSEEEQEKLVNKYLKVASSPISKIQFLKVLISRKNKKFKKIIIYLMKTLFTKKFQFELKAFLVLLNYVKKEFNIKYSSLYDDMKLALIWIHTSKLMTFFNAYGVDYNWIIKEFTNQANKITIEIFRPDSDYNNDILNKSFTHEEFVLASIDYITDSNLDYFKDTIIEEKSKHLLNTQDIYIKFTPPTHINYNLTNSFLEFNTSLLPELEKNIQSLEKNLLQENYSLFTSLLTLKYGFTPLRVDLHNKLIKYIKEYQPKEETIMTLYDLHLFTKQLKNIHDKEIFKLVIQYIKNISVKIKTEHEQQLLIEILFYLPIAQTDNLKKRLRLISKYISLCNALTNDEIKFMVNRFLMELPVEYSKYFLPLKFQTYKNKNEKTENA